MNYIFSQFEKNIISQLNAINLSHESYLNILDHELSGLCISTDQEKGKVKIILSAMIEPENIIQKRKR